MRVKTHLKKRRDAISKAMKKESKGVGGVVGIPSLGDMVRDK